jgi:uncharacterized metal-binding protein
MGTAAPFSYNHLVIIRIRRRCEPWYKPVAVAAAALLHAASVTAAAAATSLPISRLPLANPAPCVETATTACIDDQPGDRRWQARVAYQTAQGGGLAGDGQAIALSPVGVTQGSLFWFFSADNPEMLIKVLDGCAVDQHFWVFASATTNVGYTLTLTDTRTGLTKAYLNPDGTAALPVQDTTAFACTAGDVETAETADSVATAPVGAPSTGAPSAATPRLAAASAAAAGLPPAPSSVEPLAACTAATLCIDGRFAVDVMFAPAGSDFVIRYATAVSLASLGVAHGGILWFFTPTNPEILVKVLDGCAINQHHWVFYAAGTNVGFQLIVADAASGHVALYGNDAGTAAAPVLDTAALPCS